MDKIVVVGNNKLEGQVSISGAKNSSLPIIFSTLLCDGAHKLNNVPDLVDVNYALKILNELGAYTEFKKTKHSVLIQQPKEIKTTADYDLVRKMRASILVLGPILARYGYAKVSLPGGCAIGTRPIDLHLKAMESLGASITLKEGYVEVKAEKLKGGEIDFSQVTVGGTENALMASVLAEGETVIKNAAQEPEIVDLANHLKAMGAKITGAGESEIFIEGVKSLSPAPEHSVISDRIEAGTFIVAAAITKSDIKLLNCDPKALTAFLTVMEKMGVPFNIERTSIEVFGSKIKSLKAAKVKTSPHPGYPTDLQAQLMVLMTQAEGESFIEENIFENRFMHVQELARLGAKIKIDNRTAVVQGNTELTGAPVMATDLRASACLILAGLCAKGVTEVSRIYHLDRGYERIEEKLSNLSASIKRV